MAEPSGDFGDWFRWGVSLVCALLSTLIAHLYLKIDAQRERADTKTAHEIEKVWDALEKMRENGERDRRAVEEARTQLAASIVTRDDLNRQIDRLMALIGNRRSSDFKPQPGDD